MSEAIEAIRIALELRDAALKEIGGCSDGGCCIIRPRGQHTNGGCRCARYPENARNVEKALRINQIFAQTVSAAVLEP